MVSKNRRLATLKRLQSDEVKPGRKSVAQRPKATVENLIIVFRVILYLNPYFIDQLRQWSNKNQFKKLISNKILVFRNSRLATVKRRSRSGKTKVAKASHSD